MLTEKWKNRLKRSFKLRFAVLYPFGIWAVLFCHSTDDSIMRSIWAILLGLFIRAWANCYAVKMEKLTTSGPYAYVRHPLYLGSFLIAGGFLLMLDISWIWALLSVLFIVGFVYKITIHNEEAMLIRKFGQEYVQYQKSVPALWPALTPFKGGEKWGPSIKRYFKSQEYKLAIWMIVLAIVFHLKEEFIVEGEHFDTKIVFLIVLSSALGLLDAAGEIFLRRLRKNTA